MRAVQKEPYDKQVEMALKYGLVTSGTALIAHQKIAKLGMEEPEFVKIPLVVP